MAELPKIRMRLCLRHSLLCELSGGWCWVAVAVSSWLPADLKGRRPACTCRRHHGIYDKEWYLCLKGQGLPESAKALLCSAAWELELGCWLRCGHPSKPASLLLELKIEKSFCLVRARKVPSSPSCRSPVRAAFLCNACRRFAPAIVQTSFHFVLQPAVCVQPEVHLQMSACCQQSRY